ncbi:MAG: hypothetical protein EP310_09645 [Bacteroidetes bacterium]|nr:MAG: hypothetical protein EP310_09645 [Bacteroidota bacterium]
MNKLLRKITLIVLFISAFTSAFSQVKFEKESRLKRADIPPVALKLIESLAIPGKIKWYSEESLTGNSVEAKFRFNKKHYSVEFDTEGNLQDVEITIEIAEIQEGAKENIFKKLESEFNKFSIQKIQAHYPGKNPEILSIIKNPPKETGNNVKYELVVNGKTENTTKQYEMVFDNNGILTEKKEIIQKNADNLEF